MKNIVFKGLALFLAMSIAAGQEGLVSLACESDPCPGEEIILDEDSSSEIPIVEEKIEDEIEPDIEQEEVVVSDAEENVAEEAVAEESEEELLEEESAEFTDNGGELCNGITWSFSGDGTLTVQGKGKMPDKADDQFPWYGNRDSVKKVVIKGQITAIGKNAFYGYKSLKNAVIDSDLTEIHEAAFYYSGLESINLPKSLRSISANAFSGTKLTKIVLPEKLATLEGAAFSEVTTLSEVVFETKSLSSVGPNAFFHCTISKVTFPAGMQEIPDHLFYYARFNGCDIKIPASVKRIGEGAFLRAEDSKGAMKVSFEDGSVLNSIDEGAFEFTNIETISLPKSLATIDREAFRYSKLKEITIPEGVSKIDFAAFSDCAGLKKVVVNSKQISSAGTRVFYKCAIANVSFADGLKTMPASLFHEATFDNCSVIIPKTVTSIGNKAFYHAEGIIEIKFEECSGLTDIGEHSFALCSIDEIRLPQNLKTIGRNAFFSTNLSEITIPSKVTAIGSEAFCLCPYLTEVTLPASVKSIGSGAFQNSRGSTIRFYVKEGTYAYKWVKENASKYNYELASVPETAYVITYDPNGKGAKVSGDSSFELTYGAKFPKKLSTATWTGYSFAGWYTLPEGGSKIVPGKTVFAFDNPNNARIYAHWKPVKYKITYKLEGGKQQKAAAKTYTTDKGCVLPTPTKKGYSFAGWEVTAADGLVGINNTTNSIPGNTANHGNVTLKAQWTANKYRITIHEAAGSEKVFTMSTAYTYDQVVNTMDIVDALKKQGASDSEMIASFCTKSNGKGKVLTVGKAYSKLCIGSPAGEKDIYALDLYINRAKTARYKVTYELNGGTISKPIYAYSTASDFKLPTPKKVGYKFAGWENHSSNTVNTKTKGKTLTIKKGSTGEAKFTATWIKK